MIICFFSSRPYNEDFRRFLAEAMNSHVDAVYHFFTGWRGVLTDDKNNGIEYFGFTGFIMAILRLYNLCKDKGDVVYFDTTGGNNFLKVIILRLVLPKGIWCFDIFDNLLYDLKGMRRVKLGMSVSLLARLSDIQLTLSVELLKLFPRAHCFGNAGHTIWIDRSNASWADLVILSSIDWRFDFDLVERVSSLLRPSERIHLYGKLTTPKDHKELEARLTELLCRRPNIVYHGVFRMNDVDQILKPFAIGLTPYAIGSPLTRYINPDKYYLYLNAGMEVISTPIPQAMQMKDRIHVAESANCIVSIMRALQASRSFRRNAAPSKEITWRFKAAELISLIKETSSASFDLN
jgi:hypothetical protein